MSRSSVLKPLNFGDAAGHDLDRLAPSDTIVGGAGDYTLDGTAGDDLIRAGRDSYVVNGLGGADVIHGVVGYDQLSGYSLDSMGEGVDGADTIVASSGGSWMAGCGGDDSLVGRSGDDDAYGALMTSAPQTADGNDVLDLGGGNDWGFGNYGADTILGGAGDDVLAGQWGDDTLDGGAGTDLANFSFHYEAAGVAFDASAFVSGARQVLADGFGGHDTLVSIEEIRIFGSEFADTLTGTRYADTIGGADGDDLLRGGRGDDDLTVYAGASTLLGGGGTDAFHLIGRAAYADATSQGEHVSLDGGEGDNTLQLDWSASSSAIVLEIVRSGRISGQSADGLFEILGSGVRGATTLSGGAGDDQITAGAADDVVYGGAGDDRLAGGAGHDIYGVIAGPGDPMTLDAAGLDVGGGRSAISSNRDGLDIVTGFEAVSIVGTGGGDTIVGSAGDDLIYDGREANQGAAESIDAGSGDDRVQVSLRYPPSSGPSEPDTITGGKGVDTLDLAGFSGLASLDLNRGTVTVGYWSPITAEVTGFEVVHAGDFAITITGSAAAETLVSGAYDDSLFGGGGRDVLEGGGGADRLDGGDGADTFVFTATADSTADRPDQILHLQGFDVIDLQGVDANSILPGDQSFTRVDGLTGAAGELALSYDGVNTQVLGDTDGDGTADFVLSLNGDHRDFSGFLL